MSTLAPPPPSPAAAARHRPMLPVLRASNGGVYIADDDRKQGTLLVGGQNSGKTSAELRIYQNDIRDPNAAVILFDPKSELAQRALELTPPDCGKRVWYLDLGRPAFGMTPLRMYGDQAFAAEAAAIADGIVESLLDQFDGQLQQSSRDLLYNAVIGALAIAHFDQRPPTFEDVYSLLLPGREDAREAAATCCAKIPDLDQTAYFFKKELPDDLKASQSSTADRLRSPRNKIRSIVGVPPLRRFLNHPTDLALRTVIQNRDILLVDANMAAVGETNAQACMAFIFRLLHREMQRQVRLPEEERPRVATIFDEFHYLASENVVDQVATHRAAGMDVTAAIQFFSQLGAGAQSAAATDKIRRGVINLLQSRFLFRLGDPDDAEAATRIAMSVYQSMIRSDADSRAQMRVAPEAVLNLPKWHCLASWISNGARASSFIGQTYAIPKASDVWARMHLEAQEHRVGEYPEHLAVTLRRRLVAPEDASSLDIDDAAEITVGGAAVASGNPVAPTANTAPAARDGEPIDLGDLMPMNDGAGEVDIDEEALAAEEAAEPAPSSEVLTAPTPPVAAPTPAPEPIAAPAPAEPQQRPVSVDEMLAAHEGKAGPDIYETEQAPEPDKSLVRTLVGNVPRGPIGPARSADDELPDSLRELAFVDRINEVHKTINLAPKQEEVGRLYEDDLMLLKFLDRNGITMPTLLSRAVMPDKSDSQQRRKLGKLFKQGLVGKRKIGIENQREYRGQLPNACELTKKGFDLAKERGVISDKREFRLQEVEKGTRLPHDHHAVAWMIELHRLIGDVATDTWRTPRYATGRFPVPHTGNGHRRRQIGVGDIEIDPSQAIFDVESDQFAEIKPDVAAEMYVPSVRLRFDVLIEYQHRSNLANYDEKFRHYDQFLTGWCLEHPRFKQLKTRPVVVVVAANEKDLLDLARRADRAMKGAVGVQGTEPQDWYYAGRDHIFFALEQDIHCGSLGALALPAMPPDLRARLGTEGLQLQRVALFPQSMVDAAARKAGRAEDDKDTGKS